MSLPYVVAPGGGTDDAIAGDTTLTEYVAAERIQTRAAATVAAVVVSLPGRAFGGKSAVGT